MAAEKTPTKEIFPILLVNFIGTLGYSIVLPFLAVIVLKLGGNALVYGMLGAAYSFFQLIGSPVLGNLSDKYGRRKLLLLSEAGTFIGWVIFLLGLLLQRNNPPVNPGAAFVISVPILLLFAARALDGLTGGNISIANAYLADISSRQDRKRNFGKMAAAANLGVIFGPLAAGLLGSFAWGSFITVITAAVVSLFAIAVIWFRLRDDTAGMGDPSAIGKEKRQLSLRQVLQQPYVPYFLLLYFAIYLAFNFFYVAFPIYSVEKLHWTLFRVGLFFAVLSGALVLVQGPLLGAISGRFSAASLIIAGHIILAAGFYLLIYPSDIAVYSGALLFALGDGLMWPSFTALLSNTGDERTQGSIQGLAGSAGGFASIAGLVSGAFLYRHLGAAIFLVTCCSILAIGLISIPLVRIERKLS